MDFTCADRNMIVNKNINLTSLSGLVLAFHFLLSAKESGERKLPTQARAG
jgi:hypothetical protein